MQSLCALLEKTHKPEYKVGTCTHTHIMFTQREQVHQTSMWDRKMFTNTQTFTQFTKPAYKEERCSQTHNMFTELTNQHTGKKEVHKHTMCSHSSACGTERCSQKHNMFTGFTTSIQGRKMFTNTQYVHRVNKPAYREEKRSQTHNMLTNQHTGKKDVHKHTICSQGSQPAYREERCSQTHNMFTGFTTSIQGRKMFTNTQYVNRVHNQHTGKKDVHKHTIRSHSSACGDRKMFTNTQYVHRVNKPAYREERCSQTHNMFTRFTKPACIGQKDVHKHTKASGNSVPSNTNIVFVGWGSVIVQCDKILVWLQYSSNCGVVQP